MTIQLKPEQEQFIKHQISSGRYTNADDVINEAFKLLEELQQKLTVDAVKNPSDKDTKSEFNFTSQQEEKRKKFFEDANQAYINLRNNPQAWQEELEERLLWENTLADELEEI